MFGWFFWYHHRGFITSLRLIRCIRYDIKKYYSAYVHRIIAIRLNLRCYLRRGTTYMYSSLGCTLLASMNHPIHLKHTYDKHKKYRVLLPPTQTLYCVPTNPTTFETTPNDRDNNIYEICTVLAHWCTSVVWSVSIRMREIFRLVTHITINLAMKNGRLKIQQYTLKWGMEYIMQQ